MQLKGRADRQGVDGRTSDGGGDGGGRLRATAAAQRGGPLRRRPLPRDQQIGGWSAASGGARAPEARFPAWFGGTACLLIGGTIWTTITHLLRPPQLKMKAKEHLDFTIIDIA